MSYFCLVPWHTTHKISQLFQNVLVLCVVQSIAEIKATRYKIARIWVYSWIIVKYYNKNSKNNIILVFLLVFFSLKNVLSFFNGYLNTDKYWFNLFWHGFPSTVSSLSWADVWKFYFEVKSGVCSPLSSLQLQCEEKKKESLTKKMLPCPGNILFLRDYTNLSLSLILLCSQWFVLLS